MFEVLIVASLTGLQDAPPAIDFAKQIQPILEARCVKCHGPKRQRAKLRLDQAPGDEAPEHLLVPGDPAASEIYVRISLDEDDLDLMPADGDRLPEEEIELIRAWIEAGAVWDAEPASPEVAVDMLEVPTLTEEELAAEAAAIDAVTVRGGRAARVAQSTQALDVNMSLASPAATDEDVKLLAGMKKTLVWLNLGRSSVSPRGVRMLGEFRELRRLQLHKTAVDDASLAALVPLTRLTHLNLYGTGVTDAGLESLAKLPALKRVYLWQTQVTDEGAERLQAARPGLEVILGRAPVAVPVEDPVEDAEKKDEAADGAT